MKTNYGGEGDEKHGCDNGGIVVVLAVVVG